VFGPLYGIAGAVAISREARPSCPVAGSARHTLAPCARLAGRKVAGIWHAKSLGEVVLEI
jgi:hypothetical protein